VLTARIARRASVVAGLFLALIVATGLPASASFSASSAASTTITTATVVAPDPVTVSGRCTGINYNATVSWTASTSADVIGYRVLAYLNTGTTSLLSTTDAATFSLAISSNSSTLSLYQPTITVTTLTSYGWTAESAHTAVLSC
jgi:hypothetical protein